MPSTIVIPTIREEHIKAFLAAWKDQFKDQRVIVVEDHPTPQFTLPPWVEHYTHEDIDHELGEDGWIICRGTSAIRNYGTFKAMQRPTDMIWHLDDDCMPYPDGTTALGTHKMRLDSDKSFTRWRSTSRYDDHLRGMPYKTRGSVPAVVVSHGTWKKNPDYDAPHQLANPFDFEPFDGLILQGQYFSMCGMNLAFKPEVAAAMYFAPSGGEHPYDRFDDIWMGIIAKRIFDHLRLYCYTGYPQIIHDRASDPFKNLIKEAPGIEANEGFWQWVDAITLKGTSIMECVYEIAFQLKQSPYRDEDYFRFYGDCLTTWNDLLQ